MSSSPQQQPAPQSSPGTADQRSGIGHYLLLVYVFLLLGRIPEITAYLLNTSLYQIFVVSAALAVIMLFTGTALNALRTRPGRNFLALHVWLVLACIFSYWHSGSLQTMTYVLRYVPMVFFMGAFIRNSEELRRAGVAAALATVAILIWAIANPAEDASRLSTETGRFANSNELAIYFSVGGPFLVYIAASRRFFMLWRAAAAAAALLCVYELLRTGSRGGLITVIVLGLICFITGSARLKLGIVVAASALACVAAAVIPAVTWTRLGTVFSQSSGDTTGAASSAYARRALLLQSIAITFEHPLFGVGPGVYAAAAADRAKEIGEHTNWQVTHNAYTELSAESGIPGLILFLMTLASILGSALAMRRRCRRTPGHEDEAILAGCIVLSAVAFCINCIFASIGTDFYLYMVGGFAVAAARLNMRAAAEPAPEPAPAVRTFPEPFPAPQPEEAAVRSGSALERRLAQRKLEQAR